VKETVIRGLTPRPHLVEIERRLIPTEEEIQLLREEGLQTSLVPKSLMCHIKSVPYKHQIEGYLVGLHYSSAALLMEQGTGKTLSAIGILGRRYLAELIKRVLIICPKSAIPNWTKEFKKHTGFAARIVEMDGKGEAKTEVFKTWKDTPHLQVAVISYQSARIQEEAIQKWKPDMIICDESQKIKGYKAKQSKAIHRLGSRTRYRLIMTGTPIVKSPLDVFGQYRFLDSKIFGKNYGSFESHYAVKGGYGGFKIKRYKNQEELSQKMHGIAYRKKMDECLDMPPFVPSTIFCDLEPTPRKIYDKMEKEFIVHFLGGESAKAPISLTGMQKCHQIAGGFLHRGKGDVVHIGSEKLEVLQDLLEDFPKKNKLVIFAQWVPELKAIKELVKSTGRSVEILYGKTKSRGELVSDFQEGDLNTIVVQVSTGGVSIDLYAAHTAIFYSTNYSYGDYDQCRSRLRRIGTTAAAINLIHIVCRDTIDENVMESLMEKRSLAEAVVDRLRKVAREEP